ncbi:MAG TPA: Vms1/Ankzf1 family peptidyl-tRNA hydrolase [Conexibacter sp.]|nr:Vms1/Ankzf1 family peptidyl-tRNA hydrolase [Conexibacter sp.]
MQLNDVDHDRLRHLAALRPAHAKVLSVYLDLDPATFGTQPARARQIGSLLDKADRRARHDGLDHPAHAALRADVERVRAYLRGDDFSAKGAHALAIFACGPADVFETLRLPDAVEPAVVVNDAPWIDPLVGRPRRRRCIALVNRRSLRVLLDDPTGRLREVADLTDDVHGRHDQGGWSQARYQRSIEQDVRAHLETAATALFELHRRTPFDVLAVGAAQELWPELERALHPYLRERTLGRFDVEVEHATREQALAAARPLFDADAERAVAALLARLQAGIGAGDRAVAGFADVQRALAQRRVEALLYDAGFDAPGFDAAIADALLQAADVVPLRDRPELGPLGGVAALLRF